MPDCEDTWQQNLAGELKSMPGHLAGALEPALVGFLHVAMARELQLAASVRRDVGAAVAAERDRLLTTYSGIQSKFDAVRYLRAVERKYLARRG